MNITLRAIDKDNFKKVISLKVEKYCASNLYSLAQTKIFPEEIPLAIYNDEEPVGFIMYGIEPRDSNVYWIDRFMIDEAHQRKGFGKKALEMAIDIIKQDKTRDTIKISTNPENAVARKLYADLGFYDTNELDDGEVLLVLKY
ncbi:MAG: GNAT family N-acetyltransferase [Clostridiales bacterium]|nr:GNAT family N-acetyltransferase [Clostridiales bacterium]